MKNTKTNTKNIFKILKTNTQQIIDNTQIILKTNAKKQYWKKRLKQTKTILIEFAQPILKTNTKKNWKNSKNQYQTNTWIILKEY